MSQRSIHVLTTCHGILPFTLGDTASPVYMDMNPFGDKKLSTSSAYSHNRQKNNSIKILLIQPLSDH